MSKRKKVTVTIEFTPTEMRRLNEWINMLNANKTEGRSNWTEEEALTLLVRIALEKDSQ